ncbi:YopJ family acetyltransferase [Xenorhabdus bharatensis]|uniref:YopJ family acetyltransferase n=1 Tax=Xenorhabdus bharatensis TaxID=3136256 RepID=UPI0030F3803B
MNKIDDRRKLDKYINNTNKYKSQDTQFNSITADMNVVNIILRHFNHTHPDMNALESVIDSNFLTDKLHGLIDNLPKNQHKRCIIDAKVSGAHFAAANIFKDDEGNTSVICIDSSLGHNPHITSRLNNINSPEKKIRTLYIFSQIQNSPADCLLFSLHFLKKMQKHSQHFINLHQKIFQDEIAFSSKNNELYTPKIKSESDQSCLFWRMVYFNQAINLLPIDFFKHANSINPINAYLAHHPDEANIKVNKWNKGETLRERYERHTVTRMIENKQRTYSASIEEKRLSLAQAALRWLNENG